MDNKHIINPKCGARVWRNKLSKYLFAHQSYGWVNHCMLLYETKFERRSLDTLSLEKVIESPDWIPVTKEEADKVKGTFVEIYDE